MDDKTFLEKNAVTVTTQARYEGAVSLFHRRLKKLGLQVVATDATSVDMAMSELFDDLFFEGEAATMGHSILVGWQHVHP